MHRIYGDIVSGNCYKIKLLMNLLDIKHEWVHLDLVKGETRTEEFKAKNPNGKIPLLEMENGQLLFESNAILNFLAEGSALIPQDAYQKAKVLEWQFFEQYSHEPYIATSRYIIKYLNQAEEQKETLQAKHEGGYKALGIMEKQLSQSDYLVGGVYSIADISLYGYTHVAHEGGFDLSNYPKIQAWFQRIESHPKHISIQEVLDHV